MGRGAGGAGGSRPGGRGGEAVAGIPIISGRPETFVAPRAEDIDPRTLWWAGGTGGFIDDGKSWRIFHGTDESKVEGILEYGLKPPGGVGPKWYMTTTDFDVARSFATYKNPVVIEYRIPVGELRSILWKGDETGYGDVQNAVRETISRNYVYAVYRTTYRQWPGRTS